MQKYIHKYIISDYATNSGQGNNYTMIEKSRKGVREGGST